jgi:hypothetical protein
MTQADQGTHEWTGRTVHGRDGAKLGKLTEVVGRGPDGHGTWGVGRGRRRRSPHGPGGPGKPAQRAAGGRGGA